MVGYRSDRFERSDRCLRFGLLIRKINRNIRSNTDSETVTQVFSLPESGSAFEPENPEYAINGITNNFR